MAMDHTIVGAASGETAEIPRRRRVHNLRQKDRRVLNNCLFRLFIILMTRRLERIQSLFFWRYLFNISHVVNHEGLRGS